MQSEFMVIIMSFVQRQNTDAFNASVHVQEVTMKLISVSCITYVLKA